MASIDLNCDLGEGFGPWRLGDDAAMLGVVTSASIACGGHAGDAETMAQTLALAAAQGVSAGAHPGYVDLAGFGRRALPIPPEEAARAALAQVGALLALARLGGSRVRYVKPHGALANRAASDPALARALATAFASLSPRLAILAISGSAFEAAARDAGLQTFAEVYADRGYRPDGALVPRSQPGALLSDPEAAARRLLDWLHRGRMATVEGGSVPLAGQSICLHGDSPGALAMARHLRQRLSGAGVTLAPFLP